MKNSYLTVPSLLLAAALLLFPAFGQAQNPCGLIPSSIDVTANTTCAGQGRPHFTVDVGNPGFSGVIEVEYFTQVTVNGITFRPNQNSAVQSLQFVGGRGIGELSPIFGLYSDGMQIQLERITVPNFCTQDLSSNLVRSNVFGTNTGTSITTNIITVDDASCAGTPNGTATIRFTPVRGNEPGFNNLTRFSVRRTDPGFLTYAPPMVFPNGSSNSFLIQASALNVGTYTILVYDNQEDCETVYEFEVASSFDAAVTVTDISCSGDNDGIVDVDFEGADAMINGAIFVELVGPTFTERDTALPTGVMTYPTVTFGSLPVGNYTVNITDANMLCTGDTSFTISEPAAIATTSITTDPICSDADSFFVDLVGVGGLPTRYRILDPNSNNCFDTPQPNSMPGTRRLADELVTPGVYRFGGAVPDGMLCGIEGRTTDTVVDLTLRLIRPASGDNPSRCTEDFPFALRILGNPTAPTVTPFTVAENGDTLVKNFFCPGDDIDFLISDFDSDFDYTFTYQSFPMGSDLTGLGAFADTTSTYTGPGSVVGSFQNVNNFFGTVNFSLIVTNENTGCGSSSVDFDIDIRPLPVLDSVAVVEYTDTVCSEEDWVSPQFTAANSNFEYLFEWDIPVGLTQTSGQPASASAGALNSDFRAAFSNQTNSRQTATVTVTPIFPQNVNLLGGGSVLDTCLGTPQTFMVTVEPEPVFSLDLTVGDVSTTLNEGDIEIYDICTEEDFQIANLTSSIIDQTDASFVELSIDGDARFLGVTGTGAQGTAPIGDFTLGQTSVSNIDSTAQTAILTLTPYFENGDNPNAIDGAECAGQPITIIVSLNPEAPVLPSPQRNVICSGEETSLAITNGTVTGSSNRETVINFIETFDNTSSITIPSGAVEAQVLALTVRGGNGGSSTDGRNGIQSGGVGAEVNLDLLTAMGGGGLPIVPGDVINIVKGAAGASNGTNGDGGGATAIELVRMGNSIGTIVAAGGGGAGLLQPGANAENITSGFSGSGSAGATGTGPGGLGGQSDPTYAGGAGNNNGGGGGGGVNGGDGGDSFQNEGGEAGTSSFPSATPKSLAVAAEGSVTLAYQVTFDDLSFIVNSVTVPAALEVVAQTTQVGNVIDSINGDVFRNPTNDTLVVTYNLTATTAANCGDGSDVEVRVVIEPEPTLELMSNGSLVTGSFEDGYVAQVCTGDSLSLLLDFPTTPTNTKGSVYVLSNLVDPGTNVNIIEMPSNDDAAASNGIPGGPGMNSGNFTPIPFYETALENTSLERDTIVYEITAYIANGGMFADDCAGPTTTLTVYVDPPLTLTTNQADLDICSGQNLDSAGLDFLMVVNPNVPVDEVRLVEYEVSTTDPGFSASSMNFDTTGLAAGGVVIDTNMIGNQVFTNLTGGRVDVDYTYVLVSEAGCESDPFELNLIIRAEPIIDTEESLINRIDTIICSGANTGIVVRPADSSAYRNGTVFSSPQVELDIDISELSDGVTLSSGSYPVTANNGFFIEDDVLTNTTREPVDVIYTVVARVNVNNRPACESDTVRYTVTVNPEPYLALTLTAGDSTETFDPVRAAPGMAVTPRIEICGIADLIATVRDTNLAVPADTGRILVNYDIDGTTTRRDIPLEAFLDSLSLTATELSNTSAGVETFRVAYRSYFNYDGMVTGGQANVMAGDCDLSDPVEFDVVVNPTGLILARLEDGTGTTVTAPNDTICSGENFGFSIRTTAMNNATIDSFDIQIDASGAVAPNGTSDTLYRIFAPPGNNLDNFIRVNTQSFTNESTEIVTVSYIVSPVTGACPGIPDTFTVSIRPAIQLEANVETICIGGESPFSVMDVVQETSTQPGQFQYRYLGGTARFFFIQSSNGGPRRRVTNPGNQGGNTNFRFQGPSIIIDTDEPGNVTDTGSVIMAVRYQNPFGCDAVLKTFTFNITNDVVPGTPLIPAPVRCEGDPMVINLADYLQGETLGGVWTRADGRTEGTFDPAGFFTAQSLDIGFDSIANFDFTYTVGQDNSGCTMGSVTITVPIQLPATAGDFTGMPIEACVGAPTINLLDSLGSPTIGGTFTQREGVTLTMVNGNDGIFDQTFATPGLYRYQYSVDTPNGCGTDTSSISLLVRSREDCSIEVPCDTINLVTGFNTISFDVLPNDRNVRSIFADELANGTLRSVIGVHPNDPMPDKFFTINPISGTFTGEFDLEPGYGYLVETTAGSQVIVCGTAIDPSLRVSLRNGFNIVGYVPPGSEPIRNYFSDLIADGNLNRARIVVNGTTQQTFLPTRPDRFSRLRTVENGVGYLLDVTANVGAGGWLDAGGVATSSSFTRLYGVTNLDADATGEAIVFTDSEGHQVATATLEANGVYGNVRIFGDIADTDVQEGLTNGADIFAEYKGRRVNTGYQFSGDWIQHRIDLDFSNAVSTTSIADVVESINEVRAYPNPTADGRITLEVRSVSDFNAATIEVFDGFGRKVREQAVERILTGFNTFKLELNSNNSGIFQVRVVTDTQVIGMATVVRQ